MTAPCLPPHGAPGLYWLKQRTTGRMTVARYRGDGMWDTFRGVKDGEFLGAHLGFDVVALAVPPPESSHWIPPARAKRPKDPWSPFDIAQAMIASGNSQGHPLV